MSIAVYHSIEFAGSFGPRPAWPSEYHHVADVDLPDESYERAFELTNTIERLWWENVGVTPNFESPAFFEVEGKLGTRSTSVGDVLVLADGTVLRCAACGWDPIEDAGGEA